MVLRQWYVDRTMEQISSALLHAAKIGSDEALERLFSIGGERLLAAIRLRLGRSLRSRLESRDILQTTMLKAFAGIDRVKAENGASLMAWLIRIAENEIRDQTEFFGRACRDVALERPVHDSPAQVLAARIRSQSSQLVLSQEWERVERAMEALADDHREVILLRYFDEMSFKEIGERLGRSADASRVLLARAMVALTAVVKVSL